MEIGSNGATTKQLRDIMKDEKCWSAECTSALSPLQIFCYDRLQHTLQSYIPGFDVLLNPITAFCYGMNCAAKNRCISLHRLNDISRFTSHVSGHQDPWSKSVIVRLVFVEKGDYFTEESVINSWEPIPSVSAVLNDCRHMMFERDLSVHYLSHWKSIIYNSGVIEKSSILYQSDDALVEDVLSYPKKIPNWDKWQAIKSWAVKLFNSVSEGQYGLFSGERRKRKGTSIEELEKYTRTINHITPGYTTVSSWQPPVTVESGCHPNVILAHIQVLENRTDAIMVKSEKSRRYPVVVCYDGQDLNQGAFSVKRKSDGKLFLCGLQKMMSAEDISEIGLENFRYYLSEETSFVSEAKEYRAYDLAGILSSNVATYYKSAAEKTERITDEVNSVVDGVTSCKTCILSGVPCIYSDILAECDACTSGCGPCVSLVVVSVFSDMAATQVASSKTNQNVVRSVEAVNSTYYHRSSFAYGFGLLHVAKNIINHQRN